MKTEFTAAITQLSSERNLPKEVVLAILESALTSVYKKDASSPEQEISVKIDRDAGKVKTYIRKAVVESVTDSHQEISIAEARALRDMVQVGDIVEVEFAPKTTGRITAQTARQVILQRLREAESHAIYEEFANREGEVVAGTIQFVEPKRVYVKLDRTEAILPLSEQVPNEHYRKGQRLKFYLLEAARGVKGPQIIVSRSHPNLLRRLFEMEIPEVHNGIVELRAVAREAGYRTKVAVSTRQEGVDPVGCCLGPRGIRLQSIISELNGEKIDIIQWDANSKVFISNALSPAQVASIELNEVEHVATVVVPDKQLSLAIGKEGQNARLAARLTGWRIDIKSASVAETERASLEQAIPEELATVAEEPGELPWPEPVGETMPPAVDVFSLVSEAPPEKPEEKQIRFAEDILPTMPKAEKQAKGKNVKLEKSKAKKKQYKKRALYSKKDEYEE